MDDRPETVLDEMFRDIWNAPRWLTVWRFTVPVSFMLVLMFFVYRSISQGISDAEIGRLALTIAAPSLIFFLIFERTVGRRAVKKFRAEKRRQEKPDLPEPMPTTGASATDRLQQTFRRYIAMSASITVVGLLSHFLAFYTDDFDWFLLVFAVFSVFAIADFVARWKGARTWAKTNPTLEAEDKHQDFIAALVRRHVANPWPIIVGLVPMVAFIGGVLVLGALVLETENLLWTFLFWPMIGGLGIIGAFLHRWVYRKGKS